MPRAAVNEVVKSRVINKMVKSRVVKKAKSWGVNKISKCSGKRDSQEHG